jgi:hypothetical protein
MSLLVQLSLLAGYGAGMQAKNYIFDQEEEDLSPALAKSYLGTPVGSNIEFLSGSYLPFGSDNAVNYQGLVINTAIITVSQQKNIVETAIMGGDDTFKEYIGKGSYSVSIVGAIVSESSKVSPDDEVRKLIKLLDAPKALEVSCKYLNDIFDIHNLVIKSYDLGENEGLINAQYFTIEAQSDKPLIYNI